MRHTTLSPRNLLAVLALISPLATAQVGNSYQYKIFAPGLVAEVPPSGTEPAPPPAPARNYATLRSQSASFALGSDGLTVTHMGYHGAGNVVSNVGITTGKWYWEVRRQSGTRYVAIGMALESAYTATGWGDWALNPTWAIAYGQNVGFRYHVANIKNIRMPTEDNDLLGFALDMDTGVLRVYNNCVEYGVWGGWGGTRFPAIGSGGGAAGGVVVANFGASPFGCPVPAGFNPGVWAD